MIFFPFISLLGLFAVTSGDDETSTAQTQPNIVFLLADDLGWNDVGYHSSSDILTPNVDSLKETGLELTYSYMQPQCTPSRAAFLTGRYPIRYGLHHDSIDPSDTFGLPLTETILPQELKKVGYQTFMVGKWHLGFFAWEYTPTFRGFDKFYGFYNGAVAYDTHDRSWDGVYGYDLRDGVTPVYNDDYATYYQRDKMIEYIETRDKDKPFFLYSSFQAVHSPNQIPIGDVWRSYKSLTSRARKIHATKATIMDQAIGDVITTLKNEGIWDNTIVVFTSDNGAIYQSGSNYPLRGSKSTIWEGGIRVPTIINGGYLKDEMRGTESNALFHVVDWLPTFLELAGGESSRDSSDIDGVSQLQVINGERSGMREGFLVHTDPLDCQHVCGAYRYGKWKLIRDPRKTLKNEATKDGCFWTDTFAKEDSTPTIECALSERVDTTSLGCGCGTTTCLFDLTADPCEEVDVSEDYPLITQQIYKLLAAYNQSDPDTGKNQIAIPLSEIFPPDTDGADPSLHGNFWRPWLETDRTPLSNDDPTEKMKKYGIGEYANSVIYDSNGDMIVDGDKHNDDDETEDKIGISSNSLFSETNSSVLKWTLFVVLGMIVVLSIHVVRLNYCQDDRKNDATENTPFLPKSDHFLRHKPFTTKDFESVS